jgi:hypothetical protein
MHDVFLLVDDGGGEVKFALNGTSRSWHGDLPELEDSGYWMSDPLLPGAKLSIDPVLKVALALCAAH